jgi:hypothetical protein
VRFRAPLPQEKQYANCCLLVGYEGNFDLLVASGQKQKLEGGVSVSCVYNCAALLNVLRCLIYRQLVLLEVVLDQILCA